MIPLTLFLFIAQVSSHDQNYFCRKTNAFNLKPKISCFTFGCSLKTVFNAVASPSVSIENLNQASRLSRAPSLPRAYRNRSGIPVAHREFPKGWLEVVLLTF